MMSRGKTKRFRFAPALACAWLIGAAALEAQENRVPARIDNSQTVVLRGNVPAQANARSDRGAVEGSFKMPDMMLLLKPSAAQQAALSQLLQRQQDPSSPEYHRWLTPQQYADQFGVSPADISKIADWLVVRGFTVNYVAPSRNLVRFSGTAAQVANAFGTSIHQYEVGGEMHYANATDPSIPAALAGVVAGIRGLNDFRLQPRRMTK
jgi:subtilase family serine protease